MGACAEGISQDVPLSFTICLPLPCSNVEKSLINGIHWPLRYTRIITSPSSIKNRLKYLDGAYSPVVLWRHCTGSGLINARCWRVSQKERPSVFHHFLNFIWPPVYFSMSIWMWWNALVTSELLICSNTVQTLVPSPQTHPSDQASLPSPKNKPLGTKTNKQKKKEESEHA